MKTALTACTLMMLLILCLGCSSSPDVVEPAPSSVPPAGGPTGSVAFADATPSTSDAAPGSTIYSYSPGHWDPKSLEEKVITADAIVRARLKSVVSGSVQQVFSSYWGLAHYPVLEFTFSVDEYLKGSGGDEITVLVHHQSIGGKPFDNQSDAEAYAAKWDRERDSERDSRPAVLFLVDASRGQGASQGPSGGDFSGYHFASTIKRTYATRNTYEIDGLRDRPWLPLASDAHGQSSSASTSPVYLSGDELTFDEWYFGERYEREYGPVPESEPGASAESTSDGGTTVSLSELEATIAAMDKMLMVGDGTDEYRRCLSFGYESRREIQRGFANGWSETLEGEIASGSASGTVIATHTAFESATAFESHLLLERTQARRNISSDEFTDDYKRVIASGGESGYHIVVDVRRGKPYTRIGNSFDYEASFVDYTATISTTRPLPRGVYDFIYAWQGYAIPACYFYVAESVNKQLWTLTVTPPPKAVHEAFFDPVAIGSAVGADADDGVLEPTEFEVNWIDVGIYSIAWESGSVEMGVSGSARGALANHHVDFIELDGSVGLRLDFDDASETTLDDGSSVLSWGVCEQPWEAGDLLMLRVSESPSDLYRAVSDASCEGVPTATESPTPAIVIPEAMPTAVTAWNRAVATTRPEVLFCEQKPVTGTVAEVAPVPCPERPWYDNKSVIINVVDGERHKDRKYDSVWDQIISLTIDSCGTTIGCIFPDPITTIVNLNPPGNGHMGNLEMRIEEPPWAYARIANSSRRIHLRYVWTNDHRLDDRPVQGTARFRYLPSVFMHEFGHAAGLTDLYGDRFNDKFVGFLMKGSYDFTRIPDEDIEYIRQLYRNDHPGMPH